MSLIIYVLCQSDRPITPRKITGWFAQTGLLSNMTVNPDTDAFPEDGIEIRYKGAQRPITIYRKGEEETRKHVDEIMEDLDSKIKPSLRRCLESCLQSIDIDISPEHVDELRWTAIDEVEAQIADDYDGVIYVPDEGFYDRKLKQILSLKK